MNMNGYIGYCEDRFERKYSNIVGGGGGAAGNDVALKR